MDKKLTHLQSRFSTVYNGNPWYGESIITILKNVIPEQASVKLAGTANSPVEILSHILAWRIFLKKRLDGEKRYDVNKESSFRWESYGKTPAEAWNYMLRKLDENQKQVLALFSNMKPEQLNEAVSGRSYSIRDLIEGVIQHDIYHLGQINLIRKHFAAEE